MRTGRRMASNPHATRNCPLHVYWFIVPLMLALSACGENPTAQKGEKGDQGPPGSEGPSGPQGPAGPNRTVIRFVNSECHQVCFIACEENERILSAYAINLGGDFTFTADNKATFRTQRQGIPVKI